MWAGFVRSISGKWKEGILWNTFQRHRSSTAAFYSKYKADYHGRKCAQKSETTRKRNFTISAVWTFKIKWPGLNRSCVDQLLFYRVLMKKIHLSNKMLSECLSQVLHHTIALSVFRIWDVEIFWTVNLFQLSPWVEVKVGFPKEAITVLCGALRKWMQCSTLNYSWDQLWVSDYAPVLVLSANGTND